MDTRPLSVTIVRALRRLHQSSDATTLRHNILTWCLRQGLSASHITSQRGALNVTPPHGVPPADWDELRTAFTNTKGAVTLFSGDRTTPDRGTTYLIIPDSSTNPPHTHVLIGVPKGHPHATTALELLQYVVAPYLRSLATGDPRDRQHVVLLDRDRVRYISPHLRADHPDLAAHAPAARHADAFTDIDEPLHSLRRSRKRDIRINAIDAHVRLRLTLNADDPLAPQALPPQTYRIALLGSSRDPIYLLTRNSQAETISLNQAAHAAIIRSSALDLGSWLVVNAHARITYLTPNLAGLLGYGTDDLTGDAFLEQLLAERHVELDQALRSAMLKPSTSLGQSFAENDAVPGVVLLRRNGTRVRRTLRLTTLYDANQTPPTFSGLLIRVEEQDDPRVLQEELTARVRAIRHDLMSIEGRLRLNTADLKDHLTGHGDSVVALIDAIERDIRTWTDYTGLYEQLLDDTRDAARGAGRDTPPIDLIATAIDRAKQLTAFYAGHYWSRTTASRLHYTLTITDEEQPQFIDAPNNVATTLEYGMRMLLENAVKYALPDTNGQIPIAVRVGPDPEVQGLARFEVGNLVDPAELAGAERIWEQGVRLPNAAHRRGSGLGLWSLKRMVERAGGAVGFVLDQETRSVRVYFSLQRVTAPPEIP